MSAQELDEAAARLGTLDEDRELVREQLREQVLMYGHLNRYLRGKVFELFVEGPKLHIRRYCPEPP